MSQETVDGSLEVVGFEQITGLNAAKGLTSATYGVATKALIQATDQNVRWRDDGTDPTAAIGMQLAAGNDFWYTGDLSAITFIEETASAKLNVSYYQG